MKYYTFLEDDRDVVHDFANNQYCAVFPADAEDVLRIYANHFTTYANNVDDGTWNLYMLEADDPIELPFPMNLNYTDMRNAKQLDKVNLRKAIQILSKYDRGDIINTGTYYHINDDGTWEERESPWASQTDHSREHLISMLSSIIKTLGQVVTSTSDPEDVMGHQVVISTPVTMYKVPPERAIQFLSDNIPDDPNAPGKTNKHGQQVIDPDDDEDEDEYGMGGDWWKNPQEAIRRIAKNLDDLSRD